MIPEIATHYLVQYGTLVTYYVVEDCDVYMITDNGLVYKHWSRSDVILITPEMRDKGGVS